MGDGDALRVLLGTALGAFGASMVKGLASRKAGGKKGVVFRTFEQEEAAQLNPSGIVEPMPESVAWTHGQKWTVTQIDERDKGTPDDWVPRLPDLIRLTGRHPFNCEPPLTQLYEAGFVTPASLFYVRDHGAVPKRDEKTHRVTVTGNVPKPTVYTMDQIKAMPSQTIPVTLVCAGNRRKEENMVKQTIGFSWGAAGVGTSHWTGVPLYLILNAVGIFEPSEEAQYVCFRGPKGELPKGSDGTYGTSIPMHMALDPACDVMLAYEQNFKPLLPDHGFPVRLIVPGWIGGRMVKWLEEITVTKEPSDNYYHYNDNRILPPNVDAERATAEGWWYKPEYIFNQLNLNSAMAYPGHDETLWVDEAAGAEEQQYNIRGYGYTGGGRKITRAEVSLDSGTTWLLAEIDRPEKPTKYGRYWAWVFWSLKLDGRRLAQAQEVCCRIWDESNTPQPAHITWNVMGMGNNCYFRVRVHRMETEGSKVKLQFEHPTVAGPSPGGWMGNQAGGWKPSYKAIGVAAKAGGEGEAFEKPALSAAKVQLDRPRAPGTGGRKISMAEVAQHSTEHDCWIVIDGKVFDTTKFNSLHPGGGSSIFINAGTDTTEEFEAIHSRKAWGQLADWYIGDVAEDEPAAIGHANGNGVHHAETNGHLPGSAVLNPKKRIPFTLVKKTEVSHNSRIFRFAFPHADQILGLPVGMHVLMSSKVDGKLVMRAYTPISGDELPGHVDMLIKVYFKSKDFPTGGVLTQHLESLKIGDTVDFKGPLGEIEYRGRGLFLLHGKERRAKEVAMVAGGSGITPMYQVVKNALADAQDTTRLYLIFCNRTVVDILLQAELDAMAKAHPARFKLVNVLSDAAQGTWDGPRGRISEKMCREVFPKGEAAGGPVAFLCGPDGMQDAATNYLHAMGYPKDSVLRF